MPDIKRGVSLYSFQEEYFLRKMTLEDCIAKAASFGAYGIEIITFLRVIPCALWMVRAQLLGRGN